MFWIPIVPGIQPCHPERSRGDLADAEHVTRVGEVLRYAQDDTALFDVANIAKRYANLNYRPASNICVSVR